MAKLTAPSSSIGEFCRRVRQGLDKASFEQRRALIELLVDRVIVADGEVEIRYVMPTDRASEQVRILLAKSGGADRAAYLAGIGTRSAAEARHVPQVDPDRPRARGDGARRPGRLP